LNTFAAHSGISGVQPKVLIRAEELPRSVKTATHIVKFWNETIYPELAANEFFCLQVARKIGLDVPEFQLSDSGDSLVVRRFDLRDGEQPLGFEDLCVLNGLSTAQKYRGGYETAVFRRLGEFISPQRRRDALKRAFTLFVLNVAIRNGDAHLKNWGVLYRNTQSEVSLAPVYDVVTTAAYLPADQMALTLDGRPQWPDRKQLINLGRVRADLSLPEVTSALTYVADAMSDVAKDMKAYFRDGQFPQIGIAIAESWARGIRESLGFSHAK
jgi:serine/threonine-protein kinase HipA